MQASSQILLDFKEHDSSILEYMNAVDKILETLEIKIKLTSERKEIIVDRVFGFYQEEKLFTTKPNEIIGVILYELLPFLTYQLICSWLDIDRSNFMKKRDSLVKKYPSLFNFSKSP